MRKFYLLLFINIFIFTSMCSNFSVPEWASSYMEDFKRSGFLQESSEYILKRLNSRILVARETNNLLDMFAKSPQSFSTSEIKKLSRLTTEFVEELKIININRLSSFTTVITLLKNRLETNKSMVMASQFHTLDKKGNVKNGGKVLVHHNVIKAEVHSEKAVKYFYDRQYTKSMNELNEAIKKYPNYLTAYFWLGRVYVKKGDYYKAISAWEKVVNSLGNKIYISDFIEKTTDYNEAFMDILEVLSAYPEHTIPNKLLKTMQDNLRK